MAEGSSSEKKHAPTERKLRKAAEQGNIKRSADLSKTAIIVIFVIFLVGGGYGLFAKFLSYEALIFSMSGNYSQASNVLLAVGSCVRLITPLFFLIAIASLLFSFATGGWVFAVNLLAPDFSKLSPMSGLGQVFSKQGFVETGKSLFKITAISITAAIIIYQNINLIPSLAGVNEPSVSLICYVLFKVLIALSLLVGALAAADAGITIWMYRQSMMMTDQEIKDEMKDTAGNPHVKSRQKKLARKMSKRKRLNEVPKAQFVVTNPTHYAVAIQFKKGADRAPLLLAKGADAVAEEIIKIAKENAIPIIQYPPLARATYWYVEEEQFVPVALYEAYRVVVLYVMALSRWRAIGGKRPLLPKPPEGEIPVPGYQMLIDED